MNFPHKRILKSTDIKERKTKIHTLFKVLVHKLHILYHLRRHGGCLLRRTPILFRFPPFRFSVLGGVVKMAGFEQRPCQLPPPFLSPRKAHTTLSPLLQPMGILLLDLISHPSPTMSFPRKYRQQMLDLLPICLQGKPTLL